MNGIDLENLFINMKISIERAKEKIIAKNISIKKAGLKSKIKKDKIEYLKTTTVFPKNNKDWIYTKFSTYINKFNIEYPKYLKKRNKIFLEMNKIKILI